MNQREIIDNCIRSLQIENKKLRAALNEEPVWSAEEVDNLVYSATQALDKLPGLHEQIGENIALGRNFMGETAIAKDIAHHLRSSLKPFLQDPQGDSAPQNGTQ